MICTNLNEIYRISVYTEADKLNFRYLVALRNRRRDRGQVAAMLRIDKCCRYSKCGESNVKIIFGNVDIKYY